MGTRVSENDRNAGIFLISTGRFFTNAVMARSGFANRQIDHPFIPLFFHWSGLFICPVCPPTLFKQEPGFKKNRVFFLRKTPRKKRDNYILSFWR
jgi:hypothetical protein